MNSEGLLSNPYFTTSAKILLLLYASQIAPRAPGVLVDLFKNVFVKIGLIALMLYMALYDFQFSIIFAIILVLGMNVASGRSVLESYSNIETKIDTLAEYSKTYTPSGKFTLLDPQNEIYPGCVNITQKDLLNIFDNDHYKLHKSAQHAYYELLNDKSYVDLDAKERLLKIATKAGLPYNVEVNDENAPFIATLLINYNFIVSDTCKPPE